MDVSSVIDGIEKLAASKIKAEQGDYIGEDGLLYCGKCNTRKQTRIFILDQERTPFCLCKCEAERRDEEERARLRAIFEREVKELRRVGFPEAKMQEWTFENADGTNEKIINAMRQYVANFDEFKQSGKGLLLFGSVGTGKTYAAACVANALIDKGCPVLMTNFVRIANTVQGLFDKRQEYYDSLNRFPLIILDDLGVERKSEYMQEIVYNVIDSRYRAGLPLIVTTNLTSEELKNPAEVANQRTYSRLLEMCLPVKVEGTDKRREKLREDFRPISEKLGL